MTSLAFVLPLTPGKTQEWRNLGEEILGPHRSEYETFSHSLGLTKQRWYLQHTPQGDQAIIYREGDDLQGTFQEMQTSQDPFAIWLQQQAKDLFDGFDVTQTSPGSLSRLVFVGPSVEEDEASANARQMMERLGMISP